MRTQTTTTATDTAKQVDKFRGRDQYPIKPYFSDTTQIEGEPVYTAEQLQPGKMYIKIAPLAYVYAGNKTQNLFKLLAGFYLEVETDYLFNDQYNTKTLRVYDSQVCEVVGDVRSGWCKNKYTGKMVQVGKEAEYLQGEKAKVGTACGTCFWYRKQQVGDTIRTKRETETQTTETEIRQYEKKCTYEKGCTHEEAEKYGFEYFTPENTYFLKYPNGINIQKSERQTIKIDKNVSLEYVPGFDVYSVFPLRQKLWFKWYGGNEFYIADSIGFKKVGKLPIGEARFKKILKLLNNF